jgi:hypothetical protein
MLSQGEKEKWSGLYGLVVWAGLTGAVAVFVGGIILYQYYKN